MISFAPLKTKRMSVQLQELSIRDAIKLALIPSHLFEHGATEFIKKVIESIELHTESDISDPKRMTVQERIFIVGHYLAHVNEDDPDFPVGDGNYSNYLSQENRANSSAYIGDVGGDSWSIQHLIGGAAEAIESLMGEIEGLSGRFHWLCGCMAAQLVRSGEGLSPDVVHEHQEYRDWLKNRMEIFSSYPESQYVELLALFMAGKRELEHFFSIDVDDAGVIILPNKEAGDVASSARFSVFTCISEFAKRLAGKST